MGKLSEAADFVLLGRLHLRPLQMCLLSVWSSQTSSRSSDYDQQYDWISFELVDGHQSLSTRNCYHPPDPNVFLFTDASHYGWGAHLEPMRLSFHGRWTEDQSQFHINILEMMAICFALKKAITFIHHSYIMISTNNTTVVSYINKQGGTHSPNLCIEVWEILNWYLEHDVVIRVRHIPGKFNILADRLSRLDRPIKREWALDQTIVNSIFQMLNYHYVDLFVTRFNHKLPLCVSPVPDSRALAVDALSMNRNLLHAYAFPPSILIPSVLAKIRKKFVQNNSHCSSLASMAVVLRGTTAASVSSNSSSTISKPFDTVKRKISTPKPPFTRPSRLGVIKQSIRDKKFFQNEADFV